MSLEMQSVLTLTRISPASFLSVSWSERGIRTVTTRWVSRSEGWSCWRDRRASSISLIRAYCGEHSNRARPSASLNVSRTMPSTPSTSRKKTTHSGSMP
ncbi:MAG: hypothetical protein WED27_08000 [Pirellulales bacterium]